MSTQPRKRMDLLTETTLDKRQENMEQTQKARSTNFFSLEDALRELEETRQEAEEAYASDDQIDPVPNSAYDDARVLLKILHRNVPMPDIGWAEDGSLGFEWRPGNGIATMGLYGDNLVIYTAFFGQERQVEGVCALSDTAMLIGFLTMLFPPLIRT